MKHPAVTRAAEQALSPDPSPWPYGWIAFGAACSAVVVGLLRGLCRLQQMADQLTLDLSYILIESGWDLTAERVRKWRAFA